MIPAEKYSVSSDLVWDLVFETIQLELFDDGTPCLADVDVNCVRANNPVPFDGYLAAVYDREMELMSWLDTEAWLVSKMQAAVRLCAGEEQ